MAQEKEALVAEAAMDKMSVAPPDPSADASGPAGASVSDRQAKASADAGSLDAPAPGESAVADEDPLSAHPT